MRVRVLQAEGDVILTLGTFKAPVVACIGVRRLDLVVTRSRLKMPAI